MLFRFICAVLNVSLYSHCFIVMLRVGNQNVYHLHSKVPDLSVFLNQSAPSYNLFGVTESGLDFRISDQDVLHRTVGSCHSPSSLKPNYEYILK